MHVNLVMDETFCEEFEETSQELGVSPENSTLKALEIYHEKIKKMLALKKAEEEADKQNEKRQNST